MQNINLGVAKMTDKKFKKLCKKIKNRLVKCSKNVLTNKLSYDQANHVFVKLHMCVTGAKNSIEQRHMHFSCIALYSHMDANLRGGHMISGEVYNAMTQLWSALHRKKSFYNTQSDDPQVTKYRQKRIKHLKAFARALEHIRTDVTTAWCSRK